MSEPAARAGLAKRDATEAPRSAKSVRPVADAAKSGALVISLDFEIHWGVRDKELAHGRYRDSLLGVRDAVPRILDVFERYDIAATWATVGALFANGAAEFARYMPLQRPEYLDHRLDPYLESIGSSEDDDPLHFAPSLIRRIRQCPRQEIATHTFAHYYCREPQRCDSQSAAAAFEADLRSAVSIMSAHGCDCRSIVFPRNQQASEAHQVLRRHGIECYRGNTPGWLFKGDSTLQRFGRLIDSCLELTGHHTFAWSDLFEPETGLVNVPASALLRPWSPKRRVLSALHLRRLRRGLTSAAQAGRILHLWWHPHNFGRHLPENIELVTQLCRHYRHLRDRYGFQSLAMHDVARTLLPRHSAAESVGGLCEDVATVQRLDGPVVVMDDLPERINL